MKKLILALLTLSLTVSASAQAAGRPTNNPATNIVVVPPVVTQDPLPGYPRGNQGSYGDNHPNKVLICHATSAVNNNGYVLISVSKNAAEAHLDHEHQTGNGLQKAERDYEGRDVSLCEVNTPS